jgi:hypothetical protein
VLRTEGRLSWSWYAFVVSLKVYHAIGSIAVKFLHI